MSEPQKIADEPDCGNKCWYCGRFGIGEQYGNNWHRYGCSCGCGWTDRTHLDIELDKTMRANRLKVVTAQYRANPLVDFTDAGALSAPA